jgi:hypothetical protein
MASRPVPTPNSSAGPAPARAARNSTAAAVVSSWLCQSSYTSAIASPYVEAEYSVIIRECDPAPAAQPPNNRSSFLPTIMGVLHAAPHGDEVTENIERSRRDRQVVIAIAIGLLGRDWS